MKMFRKCSKTVSSLHYSLDTWSGEKLVIMAKDIRLGEYEDLDQGNCHIVLGVELAPKEAVI